ncbi:uncharacterized protein LOC120849026 [Ixodes scapularis]|uniref:uncharacterized protein LOC120849026 n=1 Tax=Ixodes scapularis TaxID=6945 RepID=UPI001A9FFF12|nr:uncharacterized protein LOC120849026 [Ixodes scapularis]
MFYIFAQCGLLPCNVVALVFFAITSVIMVGYGTSWRCKLCLFVGCFLVTSFAWHWIYLIQLKQVEIDTFNIKYPEGIPEKCLVVGNEPWYVLKRYMHDDDLCERFYQNLHIGAMWHVNPLLVLSDLIGKTVMQPMTFLGSYTGRFVQEFSQRQTVWSLFSTLSSLCVVAVVYAFFFLAIRTCYRHRSDVWVMLQ